MRPAKLRVSTPALVKQVSGFEAEFGITLFERSHSGVKVTPAALCWWTTRARSCGVRGYAGVAPDARRAMAVPCVWACR